jgi:hypothetical protein
MKAFTGMTFAKVDGKVPAKTGKKLLAQAL